MAMKKMGLVVLYVAWPSPTSVPSFILIHSTHHLVAIQQRYRQTWQTNGRPLKASYTLPALTGYANSLDSFMSALIW